METNRIKSASAVMEDDDFKLNNHRSDPSDPSDDSPLGGPSSARPGGQSGSDSGSDRSLPAHAASSSVRFRIPGDTIAKAVANLPDHQRSLIKWAEGYCRSRNLSCEDFGNEIKQENGRPYSGDSVYAVFTNRRDANSIKLFCAAVDPLRKRIEETAAREGLPFVETSLSKKIFAACRKAFLKKRILFIFGETQIGKTRSAVEYARIFNHGETKFFRIPSSGGLRALMTEMAAHLVIGLGNTSIDIRRRIFECFDDRTLVIFDEGEECLDTKSGLAILKFIRELHDRRKCGVVILGATQLRNALRGDYNLKKLWLRGLPALQLPLRPPVSDLAKFAASFKLDPAPDKEIRVNLPRVTDDGETVQETIKGNPLALQASVVRDFGLGRWLCILEDAADSAKEADKPLTWGRVIASHAQFQTLEDMPV